MPRHDRGDFSFHARYGSVISKAGIAAIPSAFFYYQGELGLKPEEVWFACVLLSYRWTSDVPYPSLAKICRQTGIPRATVTRYRRGLQEKEWQGRPFLQLVERTRANGAQTSNGYDLAGLVEALEAMIMRDRQIWFRNDPLAGDEIEDDEIVSSRLAEKSVEKPVDKSHPLVTSDRVPPTRNDTGWATTTDMGLPVDPDMETMPGSTGHEEDTYLEDSLSGASAKTRL